MADQTHNAKGFFPAEPDRAPIRYLRMKASTALTRGDAVILTSNQVDLALAASAELAGVVAQDVPSTVASDALVAVWADPDTIFVGRSDEATEIETGASSDIIGATGAMELDNDGASTNVAVIIGEFDTSENDSSVGRRYTFRIAKHAFADTSS